MNTRRLRAHISAHHFFGAELRHWREHRGLSQAELAAAIHVSPDLIRKVEHAERWPTATFAVACDGQLQSHGVLVRLQQLVESERVSARQTQPRIDHETIAHIVYQVLEISVQRAADVIRAGIRRGGKRTLLVPAQAGQPSAQDPAGKRLRGPRRSASARRVQSTESMPDAPARLVGVGVQEVHVLFLAVPTCP